MPIIRCFHFKPDLPMSPILESLSVICLCAEWCGVCRGYRASFEEVGTGFPNCRFLWLDVEDDADVLGDIDIENFPTLLIHNGTTILYFGVMLPYPSHLVRLLETFHELKDAERVTYAHALPERRRWQEDLNLQAILRRFSGG